MFKKEIDLIPSELITIETHKYYLSQKEGREVSLEEAIVDFLINYESDFLMAKQVEDLYEQNDEIMKYKWIESEKKGYDIGTEKAAEEWVIKYGSIWREEKESLEKNRFIETKTLIQGKNSIDIEIAHLAEIAKKHDCELYIHKKMMKYYNFVLFGKKEYLNVKSILCPKYLEVNRGESVEFIATGNNARYALDETEHFIHNLESMGSNP
ncbi:MAG TPA: HPr family phosphocarrier protein [Syntrophorhabdaceae bacterium]|jgi:phosphotransferase system HPr-like phosphotransfer protein|nr:HPr family phosphocarrier protein [Syntrophorhabdaceae bacterium]HOS05326.1 HPr family phosphocarrier protein [Syntrophorhabdaceae bacterium]HPL40624.1 HPr family phosphocarrier protein [Syntrophorhabdaceae bacterium]